MHAGSPRVVLDDDALRRTVVRVAHEIVEKNADLTDVCLVGIYTRGVLLADRLRAAIAAASGTMVDVGALDIAFYRDDVTARAADGRQPVVHSTRLDFPIDGRTVVLVDDVLYTGRTIRAAIDALLDYGRPGRIQLAVLVDRGHRELPIRADYVGKNLPTSPQDRVFVTLAGHDAADAITVVGRA